MTVHDAADQEQLDNIKAFFRQNGKTILISMALALFVVLGWQHWQFLRARALEHASIRYEQLLSSVAQGDDAAVERQANYLIGRYPKSSYAKLAALLVAHEAVLKGDMDTAVKQLEWVLDTASVPALQEIARVRLARIFLEQNKAEKAEKLLLKGNDKFYEGAVQATLGDALMAQGKEEAARKAWQKALDKLPKEDAIRSLLQMKLAGQ